MTHYKVDSNIDRKDEPYDAMGDYPGINPKDYPKIPLLRIIPPGREDPEPNPWRGRIMFAVELLLGLIAAIGILLWLLYISQGG